MTQRQSATDSTTSSDNNTQLISDSGLDNKLSSSLEHNKTPTEQDISFKQDTNLDQDEIEDADTELEVLEDDDDVLDVLDIDDEHTAGLSKASTEPSSNEWIEVSHIVTDAQAGQRIDKLASVVFTDFSRAQLQGWINEDKLLVDGISQKPKYRAKVGQTLALRVQFEQHGEDLPEDIPLDVVYEDEAVIVINKPVGMVVHPGAGNWSGTLVNALLYHYPAQRHLPRAGLVHRIDKDTSGLLLIAKSKPAQLHLTEQLKDKSVYRHYQCVVAGSEVSLKRHRHIDAPIGRHSTMRTKMAVHSRGRDAITHLVKITPLNENYSLLDVNLETGRTHQIRVHLSHIGYPLVGDKVYGGRRQLRSGLTEEQRRAINDFPRQALHAYSLGFVHPTTGEDIEVTAPLPEDMEQLIAVLSEGYGMDNPVTHFK